MEYNYNIELKVGDVVRYNRAQHHCKIINAFEHDGNMYFNISTHKGIKVVSKESICGVYVYYGNVFDGVVEVNGYIVRGAGGKILANPRPAVKKFIGPKSIAKNEDLTDFQKFCRIQKSGKINMIDIVRGAKLAGISEEKYEDILFNYDEYRTGKKT